MQQSGQHRLAIQHVSIAKGFEKLASREGRKQPGPSMVSSVMIMTEVVGNATGIRYCTLLSS